MRKPPCLGDRYKAELSGMLSPGGSDEEFTIHGDADRLDPSAWFEEAWATECPPCPSQG